MTADDSDYRTGYGRPPLHTRFARGSSGNRRGRPRHELAALLLAALNQKVTPSASGAAASGGGRRRPITKREAIVAQLVDKSAGADLRAIKMLIDMLKDIERKAGPPPRDTFRFTAADEEVVANLVARLRRADRPELQDGTAGHSADAENT